MSALLSPGFSNEEEPPVIVIGAGFAGASAALTLAEAGRPVLLLEAAKAPGGRARSFLDPRSGRELDWGPHLFMKANPALRDFLGRIGASPFLRFEPSLAIAMNALDRGKPPNVLGPKNAQHEPTSDLFLVLRLQRFRD